jgi:AraC family transcriptional regulator
MVAFFACCLGQPPAQRAASAAGASMIASSDFQLMQEDGGLPTTLAAGSAPGESGVSILKVRFQGGAHYSATPRQHLVWFHMSSQARFDCRIGDRTLRHEPMSGALAICPAGVDSAAHAGQSIDAMVVAVDPRRFALAAAEGAALDVRLDERFSGHDRTLLELARLLALESADDYPDGPLFWNDVASGFVDRLVARHASASKGGVRGRFGNNVLERLRQHVMAHLDEPVSVEALANIACLSPFHFARVFSQSVGMTPHRYVVRLRVQRAVELVREGRSGLAEIAARTGFADQSHLSRWVRRVHGVCLTQLTD